MDKPSLGHVQLIEWVSPGIKVARTYQWRWLRADLIAGATMFAILYSLRSKNLDLRSRGQT